MHKTINLIRILGRFCAIFGNGYVQYYL